MTEAPAVTPKAIQDDHHQLYIPHRGALCRIHMNIDNTDASTSYNQPTSFIYAINIIAEFTTLSQDKHKGNGNDNDNDNEKCGKYQYQLQFHPDHYKFMEDIFTILDTESRGYITKYQVEEFVLLRCPVLKRRDEIIKAFELQTNSDDSNNDNKNNGDKEVDVKQDFDSDVLKDEQEIYNCLFGEDFRSADDHEHLTYEEEANNNYSNISTPPINNGSNSAEKKKGKYQNNDKETETIPAVQSSSPTFDEIWSAVIHCSIDETNNDTKQTHKAPVYIGIEAWMVFCRFISLAQYQDAKRRFSTRHLQQEIPQKSACGSSCSSDSNEMIIVDVPPLERPIPILTQHLIEYELLTLKSEANTKPGGGNIGIALPELDVDHSHLFIHDSSIQQSRSVQVTVFGHNNSSLSVSTSDSLEFLIQLTCHANSEKRKLKKCPNELSSSSSNDNMVVRRSFSDMSWLHKTFKTQKQLGGTLCGRIIPPFPSPLYLSRTSSYDDENISKSSTTASVASASAVMVTSAAKSAKSFLGRLSRTSSSLKTSKKKSSSLPERNPLASVTQGNSTIRKNYTTLKERILENPESKAKQLERYLNYMLNHPAISTSFPLNAVLQASPSGIQSAKRIVENKQKSNCYVNYIMDNKHGDETRNSLERYGIPGNLSWVRTAAQAALALKLHGVLETTGYQSVSAKLQHASLPKFSNIGAFSTVDDGNTHNEACHEKQKIEETDVGFEEGIVCVESNLDDESHHNDNGHGYDMLPSPLPPSEHSALCAGSVLPKNRNVTSGTIAFQQSIYDSGKLSINTNQTGVLYRDISSNVDADLIALGDVSVDRDIDRLRDIIVTVDKSLGRCLSSGLCVGGESSDKTGYQLDLLKTIDGGESWCGAIISQRVLLNSVECLEKIREASITNTHSFISEIFWSASLASSAVSAANEVHEVVKASRTASNAKKAAETAAANAYEICQTNTFSTEDEARQAQVRSSKLRSQAIHAAVVEYEAVTAKRQAAVALARDVKCWNVHRKQELIRTCLQFVKSNQKVADQSINAWEGLRNSLLQSSPISNIVNSSVQPIDNVTFQPPNTQATLYQTQDFSYEEEYRELTASSDDPPTNDNDYSLQLLETPYIDTNFGPKIEASQSETRSTCEEILDSAQLSNSPIVESSFHDTFQENIPIEDEICKIQPKQEILSNHQNDFEDQVADCKRKDMLSTEMELKDGDSKADNIISFPENTSTKNESHPQSSSGADAEIVSSGNDYLLERSEVEITSDDGMTGSMQSLVDGLMNWGGQWDQEEDMPLPDGMAASILEEKGILDLQ